MAPFFGNTNAAFATGLICSVLVCSIGVHSALQYNDRLVTALYDAGVHETVLYRGATYEVRAGTITPDTKLRRSDRTAILRLAYAADILRTNPTVALAGTDIGTFREGVEQLREAQRLSATQEQGVVNLVVRHSLFPLTTLSLLGDAEQARRAFLKKGANEVLGAYMYTIKQFHAAYWRDSGIYEAAYRWLVPYDDIRVVTEQHSITKENTLHTIALFRKVNREHSLRNEAFIACLTSIFAPCSTQALLYPPATNGIASRPSTSPHKQPADEFYAHMEDRTFDLAYVTLTRSWCMNPDLLPRVVVREDDTRDIIREGSDLRMIRTKDFLSVPFYRHFFSLGLAYVPAKPFSHYTCPAVTHDIGAAYASYAVWQYAVEYQFSSYLPPDQKSLHTQLLRFESLPAHAIEESAARAYIETTRALIRNGTIPEIHEDTLADFTLQLDRKSAGAGAFVRGVGMAEVDGAQARSEQSATSVSIERVYFVRSGFVPLSLLMFPDVTPGDVHEPFSLVPDKTPYVYLSSLMTEMPLQEIVQEYISYHELH